MALPPWVTTAAFFYVLAYQALTLLYLWYRYTLLFYVDMRAKDKKQGSYQGERLSVIVPFYNERPDLLRRTLQSLREAQGNKHVIIVDDGSPDRSCYELANNEFPEMTVCRYEQNRGKRHAQQEGFRHVEGEFVITIDSDTVLHPDALVHLVEPLLTDERVGATTGDVKVLNRDENFLTRMIAARYWNAFRIERKALSGFGIVTCCSGVLSAYRRTFLATHMDAYTSQRFLGEECTYGDDRHLTNLLLKDGWRIHFVQDAICYTEVPTTYRQFFTQQLRWKKSFIRESMITLTFAFDHGFLLPFEVVMNLLIPVLSVALRLLLVISIILHPVLVFPFLVSVVTVALIRNYFLYWEDRRLLFYSIPYAFVHEFGLFWLYFIAAFKLKEKGWGTR